MKKLLLGALILTATLALADDRWLHITVGGDGENVRVTVPLSMAEKFLRDVHVDAGRHGKLHLGHHHNDIELRELLDAVRNTSDGEFVSVESDHENVRVAKERGFLLVKVADGKGSHRENVDLRVPMGVVEALLSSGRDELDLAAAIRALSAHGDITLLTMDSDKEKIRVWVDGKHQ